VHPGDEPDAVRIGVGRQTGTSKWTITGIATPTVAPPAMICGKIGRL